MDEKATIVVIVVIMLWVIDTFDKVKDINEKIDRLIELVEKQGRRERN